MRFPQLGVQKDPRFNKEVDIKTGYRTHSICCMPILNKDNVVIGVAQIINKKTGTHEFTNKDLIVFRNYLIFCGIGLSNAQLFELSIQEFKKNQSKSYAIMSLQNTIKSITSLKKLTINPTQNNEHHSSSSTTLNCQQISHYSLEKEFNYNHRNDNQEYTSSLLHRLK
ncbi:unnamed protein product, partial [Didymodactylos carnosus]